MLTQTEMNAAIIANMSTLRGMIFRTVKACGQSLTEDVLYDLVTDCVKALLDGKLSAWKEDKGTTVCTWMCACAQNYVKDRFRLASYNAATYRTTSVDESPEVLDNAAPVSAMSPEQYVGIKERLRALRAGLTVDESADLEAFMGATYDETAYASAKGLSITAARARKSRTLAKAMAILEE